MSWEERYVWLFESISFGPSNKSIYQRALLAVNRMTCIVTVMTGT